MKVFTALAVLAAIGVATPAGAAVHKCVDKDGKATWTDRPCTVYPGATAPAQAGADGPESAATPEATPDPLQPGAAAPETPAPEPETQRSPPPAPARGSYETEAQPSPQELERMDQDMAAEMEARFAEKAKGKLAVIFLSAALMFVAWIMHIVAAAKLDKIVWAICLFLFSPLSNLLFTILYWEKAKVGFFVYLAGLVVMIWAVVTLFSGMVPT